MECNCVPRETNKFTVLVNGELKSYERFEDIPMEIDNVIEFLPAIPIGPHTEEQHREIDAWNAKFKELMKREKYAGRN